jgi:hypothetical protein
MLMTETYNMFKSLPKRVVDNIHNICLKYMPTSLGFIGLDFLMTTITHWLGRCCFTATKKHFFGLGSRVLYWRKT